jgi:hypothetical protein
MKRRWLIGLTALLLTLLLAVPAAATQPTEVIGSRGFVPDIASRTWRPAGKNCIADVDGVISYTGDLDGTAPVHLRVVSHGPCGPDGPLPYAYHEAVHVWGTFSGSVFGASGSFEFVETAKNWPEGSHKAGYTSQVAILSGAGGLAGLHGTLNVVDDQYSGQVHFDPQP